MKVHSINSVAPVLFLVFNRLSSASKVFSAIREARPTRLYIACDGPREDRQGEAEIVSQVRLLAEKVDWPCQVKTLFRSKNIGCKAAVSGAITWFFEHEECGIILEDDCLPGLDFFRFCTENLEKYSTDERIGAISGTNLFNLNYIWRREDDVDSYYFARGVSVWGWATWRRVWKEYDVKIIDWPRYKSKRSFRQGFGYKKWKLLCKSFDSVYLNKVDTWDYQFGFLMLKSNRLCLTSNVNLIENIGFNLEATHTKSRMALEATNSIEALRWPLQHPDGIHVDYEKDDYINMVYSSYLIRYFIRIIKAVFR